MSNWRSLEKDFKEIPDPFADLRADWSDQDAIPNHWRIAGGLSQQARDRFVGLARLAGQALLATPETAPSLPPEVIAEKDPFRRWLTAVQKLTNRFEFGPVPTLYDADHKPIGHVLLGTIHNVVDASALLCLQLAAKEGIQDSTDAVGPRVHIDDIESFEKVHQVSAESVGDLLDKNGRLDLKEDTIQTALEKILDVPFHKQDWGGEDDDLYTANVVLHARRTQTAFALKGRGVKSKFLQIRDCGKRGDQLVRLFQARAELFVLQYVGEISESVIKDIEGKVETLRAQGRRAFYCVLNGQDTARLLRAYTRI